jgi:uroporphyrinogen-III synthase
MIQTTKPMGISNTSVTHPVIGIMPAAVSALREIGLTADVPADKPTTEGVIAALERHDLTGRRVGVQLYPGNAKGEF